MRVIQCRRLPTSTPAVTPAQTVNIGFKPESSPGTDAAGAQDHPVNNSRQDRRLPSGLDPEWMAFEVYSEEADSDDDDSCAEPQQPFRLMDLPPELRDIIYTFALCKETRKSYFRDNMNELNLLGGLSKSSTARALSQVCRTVHQESIKVFYSKNTLVVRSVPVPGAGVMPMPYNDYSPPCFARPDPLDLWAQTWGVLGARHIRTLDVSQSVGVVRITMVDGANPVSFDNEGRYLILSASALKAAGSKAFGTSSKKMTAARKIERFLYEVGVELRAAENRLRDEISIYRRSVRKIRRGYANTAYENEKKP